MSFSLPSPTLLDDVLRRVARRYRMPPIDIARQQTRAAGPVAMLAMAIEHARSAVARAESPDPMHRRLFIDSLADMIREAMRPENGDPAFQAMVLRHRAPQVREYASLSARADHAGRRIRTLVDAVAHPAKLQRMDPGPQRDALAHVHALASSEAWSALADAVGRLLDAPETLSDARLRGGLERLLQGQSLRQLRRLADLASDDLVQQYQMLWKRSGPRSGSATAAVRGRAARQRGADVEALAAGAIETLAWRLNQEQGNHARFRVATSMHVPASIAGGAEHAKTEWDVALLRQAGNIDGQPAWDVCLLVEAKASPDAATTDFARLLRGLQLLAGADENIIYPFRTQQGEVWLRGASLCNLPVDRDHLDGRVLYCCDAPADTAVRLLGSSSRMQLLCAPASLSFASRLEQTPSADAGELEAVWHDLLESPRWRPVLDQYASLRRVRDLMVHIADLNTAIEEARSQALSP